MRVLHLTAGNLFGGVENLQVTLGKYQKLCPEMEPEFAVCFSGRFARELRKIGSLVHVLGDARIREPFSLLRANQKLDKLLQTQHYDAVICHMCWPLVVFGLTLKRNRTPIVFWTHLATDGRHWLERIASRIQPTLAICPSDFTKAALAAIFPNIEARVIYYPVPAPTQPLDRTTRLTVRDELKTPAQDVVIVQVSRMEPMKGHLLHVEALGRLREVPGWTFWMVGGAQRESEVRYLETLRRLANELQISDRVRFTGERSDVSRLLAAADIYCQPNISNEGLPISFTEAFHAGLPVVTTRIGGFWETVDESSGRLVEPGNPDDLAKTLKTLIQNAGLRSELGRCGNLRAKEMFDPQSQMQKLCSALEEAVDLHESGSGRIGQLLEQ